MNNYLSKTRTWVEPTPEIRALHGRMVSLVRDGRRWDVTVRVWIEGGGPNAGKCSVALWDTTGKQDVSWADVATTPNPPTARIGFWEEYLTLDGIRHLLEAASTGEEPVLNIEPE